MTTSRVARKQGFASRMTAELIAADAAAGALVSALGMFEQGFYDQLGFGTGPYEHWISFDPAQLDVPRQARVPLRLGREDAARIHQALLMRQRGHGACTLFPPGIVAAEMAWTPNGFGLGYAGDRDGEITHCFWGSAKGESGPYEIRILAYRNGEQFLELLALLRNLGDQVRLVRMNEPQSIQMQDFLKQPFRYRRLTENSKYMNKNRASAYWQLRINDLAGCLARTHFDGAPLRFNLTLNDPLAGLLPDDAPWRGIGGEYTVCLGPQCSAVSGHDPALPALTAGAGAFSRLWMGALPAGGLAISDELSAPPELLTALDRLVCLPPPKPGWDF